MAQRRDTGKAARATIDGISINASDLVNISYTITQGTTNATGMGDNYQASYPLYKGMTFDINGYNDTNTNTLIDTASFLKACTSSLAEADGIVEFTLYPMGTTAGEQKVTGSAIITNFQVSIPHDGMQTITASFMVDGAPTFGAAP